MYAIRSYYVQIIMRALGDKNLREKAHASRVGDLCRRAGEALNLGRDAVKELETAGRLHDIGKIVIDAGPLDKRAPLTEKEYQEARKHPEIGYQILRAVDCYAAIAEDILSHHERWDGKGYPRGLMGTEIKLNARIVITSYSIHYTKLYEPRSIQKGRLANAGKGLTRIRVPVYVEYLGPIRYLSPGPDGTGKQQLGTVRREGETAHGTVGVQQPADGSVTIAQIV